MTRTNPLLASYRTPYGAVPFADIRIGDYLPAVKAGIREHLREIKAITSNPEPPTFTNTIEALERSGQTLGRVTAAFYNLLETDSTEEMMALSEKIQPIVSDHTASIGMNAELFGRIRAVHDAYARADRAAGDAPSPADGTPALPPLDEEQRRLLRKNYESFVRSGALLKGAKRKRLRDIVAETDRLTLLHGQNVLRATHAWRLVLTDEAEVAGLPDTVREAMAEEYRRHREARPAAEAATIPGRGWLLTLQAPSYRPFMTYAARRDLRERAYRAYGSRAVGGEYDNTDICTRIAALRLERARLLGYKTYADLRLAAGTMAKETQAVEDLLSRLLGAYLPAARREVAEVEAFASRDGMAEAPRRLQPWDFAYYSEKLRTERYAVNDELLRPYFPLQRVKQGVFGLATRLYGLTFEPTDQLPKYHPEVETYVVRDRDGSYLGLLYADFFPRPTKQAGAWMTEFKGQWTEPAAPGREAADSRPHISIVMNFTRPTAERPSLLTYDEVQTFLHEFGHALHGLLTRCRYESMSGTNVARDFVELPSQLNENFLARREFLDTFAAHYQTGEPIPADYVERLRRARTFQAAYACVRQLSFGMLDMAWHTLRRRPTAYAGYLEERATKPTRLLPRAKGLLTSASFTHIFSGGYAAGYYGYKWAEVLDADAFAVFEREGIFNPDTARRFRRLLEAGNAQDPAELYRAFRGGDATIDALMRRDGILDEAETPTPDGGRRP